MLQVSSIESKSLITMKNIDPSTSEVEQQKKESKEEEEEEEEVLFVTEKDLKDRNIDIHAKVSRLTALMVVIDIAYEKLKKKETEEKQKEHAKLGDGKIERFVREKDFKRPADYFDSKKKEKFVGEKLRSSAIKSCGISYGEVGLNSNFKGNVKPTSDPVHDVVTTRKKTFASVEWVSCSTESYKRNGFRPGIVTGVSDEELSQDSYLRKDSMFKRSCAQGKSNKRFKEEMSNCDFGSPAQLPQEVKERIASMEGKNVELVVEKQLYATDMKDGNGRLSIPLRQAIAENFLTGEEKRALIDGNCLKVKILEPSLEMVSDMNLKQWNMNKEKGNVSSSYVLTTQWNSLRRRNHLHLLDRIQVWSFRVENDLYFALVKVGQREEQRNGSNRSNNGASTASQAGVVEYGSNGSSSSHLEVRNKSRQD